MATSNSGTASGRYLRTIVAMTTMKISETPSPRPQENIPAAANMKLRELVIAPIFGELWHERQRPAERRDFAFA
jgi:hypothetical protein